MSKKGSKSAADKSGGTSVLEPIVPITPVPEGVDPSTLPFPEWSDQDVNSEKWDLPKTKDKGKKVDSKKSSVGNAPLATESGPTQYVDPQPVLLPFSINNNLHEWKRPTELYADATLEMFLDAPVYPDLISGSKHLLHSDFMRSFISAIDIMEYIGNTHPSPMESVTTTFSPSTEDNPWRPWHHIYSMTKAGKGQNHNPQVNTLGKYVVRLHWMGLWRKILVDDLLPVDITNHVLLPTLEKPEKTEDHLDKDDEKIDNTASKPKGGKKTDQPEVKVIELWPFILCKALLKLASLTWTNTQELLDFDIISCFSGWVVQKIDTIGMDPYDIWEMCTAFADHYAWPDKNGKGSKGKSSKGSDKSSKTSKVGKTVSNFLDDEEESGIMPCHVLATFTNMRELSEDILPDITPCWSHSFLIDQTRDIPIIKPLPKPDLARWKRFRWLAWAIRNGLWPYDESMTPIKCVKLVSNFRKCADHVVYKPPSKEATDIQKSVAVIEDLAKEMDGKGKGKDKKDKGGKDAKGKDLSKGSKGSKKDTKDKKAIALPPDPSIWSEFEKIGSFINALYIFMKPSQFKTYIKISDIASPVAGKGKADKGKKDKGAAEQKPQILQYINTLLDSRNEPIYVFMDTLDYKFFVINMCQVGNSEVLKETSAAEGIIPEPQDITDMFTLIKKIKSSRSDLVCEECKDACSALSSTKDKITDVETEVKLVPFSHIVVEEYNWQSNKIQEMSIFLNTYGAKSVLTNFKKGRFIARLWIKSDTPYVVQIMSDTPVVIGCLELILENMTQEPQRLIKMCYDISSSYGQLVQKFGLPEYAEGLLTFYNSYKPNCELKKLQAATIHDSFRKEFFELLSEKFESVEEYNSIMFALRVLLIDPTIKYKQKIDNVGEKPVLKEDQMSFLSSEGVSLTSEDIGILKEIERSAMIIQAYFKKLYVKKLKSLHMQTDKRYLDIFNTLKKVYTKLFSVQERLSICPNLVRQLLFDNANMQRLRSNYVIFNDMQSTIHLQHFTGNIFGPSNAWIPICRYVFFCNSPNSVIVKICLFCDLKKFVVRVVNNDNKQEMARFTNNVNVASYDNNANGYTVLCYGWSLNVQKITWKLSFVSLKEKKESLLIVPEVIIHKDIITDVYKPNVYNKICKCLIKIQNDTLVSIRLSVSYECAKVHLRCTKQTGELIAEIYGKGSVILPSLLLEFVPIMDKIMSVKNLSSNGSSSSTKKERFSKGKSRSSSLTRSHSSLFSKRKSSDRASVKSSIVSLKKRSSSVKSNMIDESAESIYKDTVFVVEGFVMPDTWPLTLDEWNVVDDFKEKQLLGLEYVLNMFKSASSQISKTTRQDKQSPSKKSNDSFARKSSDKRNRSLFLFDKPFWNLHTVLNKTDQVAVVQDKTREEEIKEIKRKWYENEPDRYTKSQELRRQYLESHYIKSEQSSLLSNSLSKTSTESKPRLIQSGSSADGNRKSSIRNESLSIKSQEHAQSRDSQSRTESSGAQSRLYESFNYVRTLKKPEPKHETLPPFDLEQYQMKILTTDDEFDDRKLKTYEDELNEIEKRHIAITEFEMYQQKYENDMTKYLMDQIDRSKLLDQWYQECRSVSVQMIELAFAERDKFIKVLIDAEIQRKAEESQKSQNETKGKQKKK